jgi:hypothetical protein
MVACMSRLGFPACLAKTNFYYRRRSSQIPDINPLIDAASTGNLYRVRRKINPELKKINTHANGKVFSDLKTPDSCAGS